MDISLNDKEAEAVLQFVDIGLKAQGMAAMGAANMIIHKINTAKQAEQKAANDSPLPIAVMPPVSESAS